MHSLDLLLLVMLVLHCSVCMRSISELFAVFHYLPSQRAARVDSDCLLLAESGLLPFKYFAGDKSNSGTVWLLFLLVPSTTLFVYTTSPLPSRGGACSMASSLAACLHSVGFEMLRMYDAVPLLGVDGV